MAEYNTRIRFCKAAEQEERARIERNRKEALERRKEAVERQRIAQIARTEQELCRTARKIEQQIAARERLQKSIERQEQDYMRAVDIYETNEYMKYLGLQRKTT